MTSRPALLVGAEADAAPPPSPSAHSPADALHVLRRVSSRARLGAHATTAAAAAAVAAGGGAAVAAPVSPRLSAYIAVALHASDVTIPAPPALPAADVLPPLEPPCAACAARARARAGSGGERAATPAGVAAAPPAAAQLRQLTICDVRAHAREESLWFTANGRVYDATSWLGKHPGGPRALLSRGGRDCDEDYAFHTARSQELWEGVCIGRLVPCDARRVVRGPVACALA